MLQIGITGNIGAGKTQVCRIFEILGHPVYYADPKGKILMVENNSLREAIISLLGKKAYKNTGELNTKYVSSLVFKNGSLLKKLNALVHPAVALDYENWVKEQKSSYVIKEAALLFEAGSYKLLDYNIVVCADEDKRIRRVVSRDGVKEEQVIARIRNQMLQEEKIKKADYIIDNNGNLSLVKQVLTIHEELLKHSKAQLDEDL